MATATPQTTMRKRRTSPCNASSSRYAGSIAPMTRGRPVALLPIRAAVHALSIHRLGFSAFARLRRRHASLILLRFPGVTRVVKVIPDGLLARRVAA
jgi:hypothetical protein